ncbi:alkaline phosphatase family protein [Niabella sp. CC-SYL272]|uniref:alkaline phosphatase family protein n=1 Tax=Niabella agricola TaxID=2891571 RepID=UPI001F444154|nr:alkaline phosphatase family protein [Niabella agricola]MCF3108543.1 alkaline phosphatase family protein [Niabella agricola]
MMRKKLYSIATGVFVGSVLLAGCKKFADPGVQIEEYKADTTVRSVSNQRKMLLINIDGLAADVLQALKPATLQSLLQNGKYSFSTATNLPVNNTAALGSMFTGNFETRLWDSTFYAVPVDSTNTIPVPLNMTAFRYIHDVFPSKKLAAVADWPNLVKTLLGDADKKVVTTSDAETKTSVENILRSENMDVVFARFSSVQKAGSQYGYKTGAEYEAAIRTVDTYIGDIMSALKSRPTYNAEKWLTVVTTTQVSDTLLTTKNWQDSPLKIPSFIIAHHKGFSGQDITKLNPAIVAKNEDLAAIMLYWLQVSKPNTMVSGSSWLDRFELEFLTK